MPTTTAGMGTLSTILSVTTLTTAYTGTTATFETHGATSCTFLISFVRGSETSVSVLFEVYDTTLGWKIVPYLASGTLAYTVSGATGNVQFTLNDLARFETQIRVSALANAGTSNTSLIVQGRLGNPTNPISGNIV